MMRLLFFSVLLLTCTPSPPWTHGRCDATSCRAWWTEGDSTVMHLLCDLERCVCRWEQAEQECEPGVDALRLDALVEKVQCCDNAR